MIIWTQGVGLLVPLPTVVTLGRFLAHRQFIRENTSCLATHLHLRGLSRPVARRCTAPDHRGVIWSLPLSLLYPCTIHLSLRDLLRILSLRSPGSLPPLPSGRGNPLTSLHMIPMLPPVA